MAAAAPIALEGSLIHPVDAIQATDALGPSHSILLSIVLAGLGMTGVRQLIALNAELHATRAELADLAVAGERARLARELHDLLGRTLSLIAVKAELASRLSARGARSAIAELADVQRLARQAVRDVREAVARGHAPSVDAELAAAVAALRSVGIKLSVDNTAASIDPAHETTIAWALREAVTNVVEHSGARTCRIVLDAADGSTALDVDDDGRGSVGVGAGTDSRDWPTESARWAAPSRLDRATGADSGSVCGSALHLSRMLRAPGDPRSAGRGPAHVPDGGAKVVRA